jgi:hypothetical protein
MKRKVLFVLTGIIVFVNLPCWDFFTTEAYTYSNADHSFVYSEEWNMDFLSCQRGYGYFLYMHPEKNVGDKKLCRNFTWKPCQFWQWREMALHSERFFCRLKSKNRTVASLQ